MMNPIVKNGNKLKWKFDDVDELTDDGMDSNKFTFQNIDWKIKVCIETANSVKYLAVYLYYDGANKSEKSWICDVKRVFKLLNQNENGKDLMREGVCSIFDASHLSWGHSRVEWSRLETDGYMKDDSIIVEIELDFKYYDFSKNIPNHTDIILHVEDTKFYVNKGLLSSKSKYFYNKFVVDKSDEKELTIENVKVEDFRCFIASVCLFFETVKNGNYEQLIKLAAEYKTPLLHRNCANYLISNETLQVERKIEFAAKYNYEELLKTCIDSLTTTDQIEKLHKWAEFQNLKNSTKLAIGKKMVDILSELERNEEDEKRLKCQSCTNMDVEENLHICQTCNEQNLKHFKNEEEVLKIAICANCAIKNHIQQQHVTINFLPHFRAYIYKNQSGEIGIMLAEFQIAETLWKSKEQTWKTMNETAETKFNELADLTRRSKSTKYLYENVNDIKSFIETALKVNNSLIEVTKTKEILMEENLQKMEKWIEEKSKECVKDEETVKLEI